MNLVAFGLILICCHAWAIEIDDNSRGTSMRKRMLQEKLKASLEKLKSKIQNGDSKLGIPPLDPFNKGKILFDIGKPDSHISLVGNFTNITVEGLSSYTVNAADFKLIGLKVNTDLTWPLIVASTNYFMKGNTSIFNIYGKGRINATVHDFRLQTNVNLGLKDLQHAKISKMSITIFLKPLDFRITGLYGDDGISKIISETISDLVSKLLSNTKVVEGIKQIIMKIANNILGKIKIQDLLKQLT